MISCKNKNQKDKAMSDDDVRAAFGEFDATQHKSKKLNCDGGGSEKSGDAKKLPAGVDLDDFSAFMPMHSYIYHPTRELWPAVSVNARIDPIPVVDEEGQPVVDDKDRQ